MNETHAVTAAAIAKFSQAAQPHELVHAPELAHDGPDCEAADGMAGDISSSVRAGPGSMGLPMWIDPTSTAAYTTMAMPSSTRYLFSASRSQHSSAPRFVCKGSLTG